MKFSVLLSTISKQLSEIASIAGSSTNKDDITQNILIKVADSILVLKATNYNIELQTEIPLTDVESEGEITVNANKLKETLSNLDQNNLVNFNYDEQNNLLVLSMAVQILKFVLDLLLIFLLLRWKKLNTPLS